jgi:hypothetical protein
MNCCKNSNDQTDRFFCYNFREHGFIVAAPPRPRASPPLRPPSTFAVAAISPPDVRVVYPPLADRPMSTNCGLMSAICQS